MLSLHAAHAAALLPSTLLRVTVEAEDDHTEVEFSVCELEAYHGVDWCRLSRAARQQCAERYALWRVRRDSGRQVPFLRARFDPASDPYPLS